MSSKFDWTADLVVIGAVAAVNGVGLIDQAVRRHHLAAK
jgi:hypothetical protein